MSSDRAHSYRARRARGPVAGGLVVLGLMLTVVAVDQAPGFTREPYTCEIGDLTPAEYDLDIEATAPDRIEAGESFDLVVRLVPASIIDAIPQLVSGSLDQVTVTITEDTLVVDEAGGTAGRTPADRVDIDGDTVVVGFEQPLRFADAVPVDDVEVVLTGTADAAVELRADEIELAFTLLAEGIGQPFDTVCTTDATAVLATVAVEPPAPSTGNGEETEVEGETEEREELPPTGATTWVLVAVGVVLVDVGYFVWSSGRPGRRRGPAGSVSSS